MKKIQLLSLLLMLACFVPQAARAEYYGIQVGGVRVTSDNCDNITGSNIWSYGYSRTKEFVPEASHVSYDPSTKTLTLNYIQIERTGSGNRAILNESCDGLTIVFEDTNYLSALAASPIRLNANTTIKCASGRYGDTQKIYGGVEDAITVGNGATLLIEDISISVSTNRVESESGVFVGNTGTERLIIKDAAVWAQGMHGVKDFAMLGVQNGHLWLKGDNAAAKNLKDFSMVGKTMYLTDTFYNDGTLNFLNSSDYSVAREVTITDYVEINETNFPDDIFRSYVSEEFDKDNDGRLTYQGEANSNYFNNIIDVSNKGLTSLKGIEHFPYLETLKCANNNLTSLDVSKLSQLMELECYCNQLTSLNVTKEKEYYGLQKLVCYQNKLTRLDIPQGVHDKLDCSYNLLTYIDFSNCSYWTNKIYIDHNRIDAFMTETLESLPDVTEGTKSDGYSITISSGTTNDNVCTGEQADIARNKGWEVFVAGLDSDGNIVYNIEIGGTIITSANADDLTVLPNVTKNCDDGYARYEPATQKLHLSGVDIVNEEGDGINFNIKGLKPTIEIGLDPVNITAKGEGISYDSRNGSKNGLLTITSKEDYWFSEKLNVISTENHAFYIKGSLILQGVARIEAKSLSNTYPFDLDGTLYVKNDAELRIKSNGYYSLSANALVLEDDNIVVTHPEATIPEGSGSLRDAEGHTIRGEVVIGKLREYNYYVAGTRISNANQHAVLGDTTVVFQEPAFNGGAGTITLNNANIEAGSEAGINAGKTLYIKLEGENTINSTTYGIASKYCYIQGPGSLYVNGKYGIDAHLSKLFISDDAKVTAEGSTQYAINGQETTISGENTVVRMKCGPDARGTFKASTSLTLNDGLKIDTPEGAQYVDGEIKDADGNVIKDEWVTIQYTEDYGITVAGIKVTNHNNKDVLGDGTISYDPETLTLTLTDANIDGGDGSGIEAEQELHIKLEGSNTITCTRSLNGTSKGVWFKGKGFIEGPGSLSITAMYGIYAIGNNQPKPLQILDGAQVSAEGDLIGIMAGITTISGEETVVNAKGGDGSFGCTGLNLNDQLEITEPAGASFVLSKFAICVGRRNTIVTSWVTIQKVDRYNLYVKGTQVTSLNEEDVLGNGTVSFDPQTSTLTLMNADIAPTGAPGIQSSIPNLNVMLVGGNFINISDDKEGIVLQKSSEDEASEVVFYGGGTLNINTNGTALQTQADIAFTDGVNVSAESTAGAGIKGVEASGMLPSLTISGETTTLKAKGADEGSVVAFRALNMTDNITIVEPAGATFTENVGITDAEGNLIVGEWVTIGAFEIYELYIAGTQVTELNKADVLGDGTVSYDAETNTLTLNGADIEAEGEGLSTQIDEVIIKLEGENSIEVPEGFGIYSDASFTITGPGSLNVTSKFEALNGSFVIEGGAKVTADSQTRSALWSFDPLAVSGSETVVMLKGAKGAVEIYGTDSEEAVLSLSDGLVLGLPEGAHCGIVDVLVEEEEEDMWIPYGYILDANDNNITDQWVIIASEDYITGINDLKDSKNLNDLNDSTYNLAGQKVGKDYKGIVIQGGKKLLKK